jgi:hypothetical protein
MLAAGKLASLEEFRVQREKLMNDMDNLDKTIKKMEEDQKEVIYQLERKQVVDKDRLEFNSTVRQKLGRCLLTNMIINMNASVTETRHNAIIVQITRQVEEGDGDEGQSGGSRVSEGVQQADGGDNEAHDTRECRHQCSAVQDVRQDGGAHH